MSQAFQFSVKNLVSLPLLGEGGAKNFSLEPKPIFGGPATTLTTTTTTYAAAIWHTMKFYCNYIYIPIPNIASSSLWHEQTENTVSYTFLKAVGLSAEEQMISETNS